MRQTILLFSSLLFFAASANAQFNPATQVQLPVGASASWWELAQKNIRESEYRIRPKGGGMFSSPNRAQNLRFTYSERGFSVIRRDSLAHLWKAEVRYIGVSKRRDVKRDDATFQLRADANVLTATSDGLLMRYRNDEKGMRQDFIVKKKPAGKKPLRLWLEARMLGGKVEVKPDAVSFLTESGAAAMRYSDLKVWDANHRRLAARFEREGERLAIVVNDENAAYPITIDPLSATPNWTAESNQANAQFGWSVASAGDVNGDGFSDVIIGALDFDTGETAEGRAFVYHGSASGLSATPNWTAESNQAFARFGISVASAGDVNGDGFSDVIVGAYFFDNGETDEGRAFVYHGSSSGLSTTANWTAESNQVGGQFGYSVASAGDVNGDGFSDVIVGAPGFDNGQTDEGAAFVYHGSASGLSATANWTAESNQADALFGHSVGSGGDVNGDGFSDVIVGAYAFDNGQTDEGAAFVYHGSASGLSTTANWTAESNQVSAEFGYSVASAGDVNGDGFSDVIVGAYGFDNDQDNEGRAFVYHGSTDGLSTMPNWTAESDQDNAQFGYSVASAGDVNGDGFSDVIVGAYGFDNVETNEGRAFVYHGSNEGLSVTPNWTAESDQDNAQFGGSAACAGDVNGDGFSDVIVGAFAFDNDETNEGRAFVYYGSAGSLSATLNWTGAGSAANDFYGISVASAGDVNGDGFSDVIVGALGFDNGETDEGAAFVYHGSASGLSATPDWTAEGNQASAFFGSAVATAGDVNGDGYSDVIIGAPAFDNGETDEGRAFVYHGSNEGLSATPNWTAESNQAGADFGRSVACAGDVNSDGFSDVIVGAHAYDNGHLEEGAAFAWHGSALGVNNDVDGTPLNAAWSAESNQASAGFGWSVASAGDVNSDGFSDIIIGAPYYDNPQLNEGMAFTWHGSALGINNDVNGTPLNAAWKGESDEAGARFGWSVASVGDMTGNGCSDVIVGAPFFDGAGTNRGAAFVWVGTPTTGVNSGLLGNPTNMSWRADGAANSDELGYSVASAGDVNGDGFSDVIIGAKLYENLNTDEGAAFLWLGSSIGFNNAVYGIPGNAAWTAEGGMGGAELGYSVACAGDVNGDGYSDVIIGAPYYNNSFDDDGQARLYYGNAGGGMQQDLGQFRYLSTTPIVPALKTASLVGITFRKREKSIAGRGRTKLQIEIKELGAPFDGSGLLGEASFDLHDLPNSLTDLHVGGLSNRVMYKWRVRQVERPSDIGFILLPRSRWHYPAGVAPTESHFQFSNDDLPLPVELSSFTGEAVREGVRLSWTTASEKNNAGFEVQRRLENVGAGIENDWKVLGFVKGKGTTSEAQSYSFVDRTASGKMQYRLKQVDFDGSFEYSPIIEVETGAPRTFELAQNYPNPFNPTTVISYQLPVASEVRLKIYDVLGREVATLVNGRQEAGRYAVSFNAIGLASGLYFYRLQAGSFAQTKKMMLVK